MRRSVTPDEARDLLDGTTPAEDWWYSFKGGRVRHLEPVGIDAAGELDVSEEDAALIVAAPTLAAMIAGMREEWGVSYRRDHENKGRTAWGWDTREDAERSMGLMTRVYVYGPVRRYVTTEEEI